MCCRRWGARRGGGRSASALWGSPAHGADCGRCLVAVSARGARPGAGGSGGALRLRGGGAVFRLVRGLQHSVEGREEVCECVKERKCVCMCVCVCVNATLARTHS